MTTWIKTNGTQTGELGLGFTGPKLKNDAGNLAVKTADDNSHAGVTAANVVVINDTTGFSVDLVASPDQLANYTFTLPPNVGTSGQFLQTAGNGSYTWETAVLPGELATETLIAVAGQTGFTLANSPTGDVSFAVNGAVVSNLAATVVGTLVTYDPAENAGYILEDADAITVTYIYGTVDAGDLNSLSDVDVISPTNGSALIYNAVTGKWVVGAGITDPTALTNGASNVSIPAASGNVNVSVSGVANIVTFTTDGANVIGNLDVTDTFTAVNANISGNIIAGNVVVPPNGMVDTFDLRVSNEAIITGNLNVLGNLNTTTTNSYAVIGPIFEFGGLDPNNAPLSINDGMDRGMLLDYFTTSFQQAFFGWDNANGRFEAGAQVSNSNNVITTAEFANIKAHTFIGNVEGGNITGNIVGNVTGNLTNGTSNIVIPAAGGDIFFTAAGNNQMTVTATGTTVAGNISVGNAATVAGNLTVGGVSNFGPASNLRITGGNAGQVLMANTGGNVEWANLSTDTLVKGNSNVIVLANADVNISANGVANVLSVSQAGANIKGNLTATGVTRLNVIGNVIINGGANGQAIITDGAGNLEFATPIIANLNNGNSNVVVNANGNVTTTVAGIANVLVLTATGANVKGTANITGNLVAPNAQFTNVTVTGTSTLGQAANVKILGGANGQVLVTDGTGNLQFTTPVISQLTNGNSSVIVRANADVGISANGVANVFKVLGTGTETTGTANISGNLTAANVAAGNAALSGNLTVTRNATVNGNVFVAGTEIVTGTLEVGANASFLSNMTVAANANITGDLRVASDAYFSAVANVIIPGGTTGQLLTTNGSGNLSWTTVNTALVIQDEGTEVAATANTINFVGAEITSSAVGNIVTVNVTPGNISNINNGTSNVMISAADGIVVTSVNGVANVWTVTELGSDLIGDLSVTGVTTLSEPANLKITGGANGQALVTDGTGNLTWADAGGSITINDEGNLITNAASILNFTGAGVTTGILGNVVTINVPGAGSSQPTIEFVAPIDGPDQAFDNPAIFNLVSNTQSQVFVNGVLARSTDYTIAGTTLTFTRVLSTGDEITAAPVTVLTSVPQGSIAAGSSGVVVTANANVGISVAGVADVAVFSEIGTTITGNLDVSGDANIVGTALIGNISVTGLATFTDVANVSIAGGTTGQVLSTDGAGVLSWVTQSGGGSSTVTPVPTIEFVATANGAGQVFTDANIALILSNAQCSTYVNGSLATIADFEVAGEDLTFTRYINTGDVISVAAFGVTNLAVTGAGGATTQLQFNQAGSLRGIASATYDGNAITLGSNAQVKITGGTAGQSLVTDGTGNLSWAATASAAGSDTELQFNNAGEIAGIPTATYDGSVLTLGAVDEVSITGGTAGQALITDGAGVLSFGETMLPGWNNAGPVIFGATITAPTKGTPYTDFVRYRKIGPREYQVQMMYSQTTGGSDGNGAYLYTLPAGLQFDFTAPGQRMTSGAVDNVVAPTTMSLVLPGAPSGMISGSGTPVPWVAPIGIIPYSATQFRVFSMAGLNNATGGMGTLTIHSSTGFRLSDASTTVNINFTLTATS